MEIILGSESKGRKRVLEDMGYTFEVMYARIDEKAIRLPDPKELTLALARAKSDAIHPRIKEPVLLITSDQVVVCDGVVREKPENEKQAREFLQSYAEYPAETVTAVLVMNTKTGRRAEGVDIAKVWFRPIPKHIIEKAIYNKDIRNCAGGFSIIDPLLKKYILRIEGERESVIGLPKKLAKELMHQIYE